MGQPLVSIIINNYNYGRYLCEAIDSAIRQTYSSTEIIVVDDGSTDDSRGIIVGYGKQVIPVFKENGGQASAFNAGFARSRGDLICFLDSDDVWLPQKVQEIVRAHQSVPDAVLIYHQVQSVDSSGLARGRPWPQTVMRGWTKRRVAQSGGFWHQPPTSALCFQRRFMQRVMPIPESNYKICADAYLAGLAPFLGPIFGVQQVLARYRVHGMNRWSSLDWIAGGDVSIRSHAEQYELNVAGLNSALERMNLPERVNLKDHWPYQRLKWKLGEGMSLWFLTMQALRFPSEPNLWRRLKNAGRLWFETSGARWT